MPVCPALNYNTNRKSGSMGVHFQNLHIKCGCSSTKPHRSFSILIDSLKDFLFRSGMGGDSEDVSLGNSRSFWQLIDDGEQAARKQ
jgi:hypothetical protein